MQITCPECLKRFERDLRSPESVCPHCGKPKLRRLISAGAAVIFKGSGFYQTDYRSKEYKDKAKADKDSAAKASSDKDSGDSKSEGSAKSGTSAKPKTSSKD